MALVIEMVVDLGVNRAEFLQRLHTSKALHGALSSSKRLMRILGAIRRPSRHKSALRAHIKGDRSSDRRVPSELGRDSQ